MIVTILSYLVIVPGLSGMLAIGSGHAYGWLINAFNQLTLWVGLGWLTHARGLIFMSGIYAALYFRNYRRQHRLEAKS